MELRADWSYPTAIRFGAGRIEEIVPACDALGIRNPLLVTDPGVAALPMVGTAAEQIRAAGHGCEVFSAVEGNPNGSHVEAAITALRGRGHDSVIAFGGGSAIDVGKAAAFGAVQSKPIWEFADGTDNWTRATAGGIVPVLAIPTTSGTGSEVGRAVAIINEETETKVIVFHPAMMPRLVICDPELVVGLPPDLTAGTGMDALAHNMEAFFAPAYHPMARGVAVEGMRLIKAWLPRAVADGTDIAARSHMMSASAMGAAAFQRGLGAIHALSHSLGSLHGAHHGLLNGIVMPYVLVANRAAIEADAAELASALGLGPSFEALLAWVVELRKEIGIPHTLAEIGIAAPDIARISAMACADVTAATNPVAHDEAAYADLLTRCVAGTLPA